MALPSSGARYTDRVARKPEYNVRVYERPAGSGRFVLRWTEHGKQRQEGGYTSRIDAEEAALKKRRELRNPLSAVRTPITLGELLAEWYDEAVPNLKDGTREQYTSLMPRLLEALDRYDALTIPAKSITTGQINRWARSLDTTDSTKRRLLVMLSAAFQHAVSDDIGGVETNPVREAKRPKQFRQPITIPTDDDVQRLDATAPDQTWRALLVVCAYAGLRQQEAFALTWGAITDTHIDVRQAVTGQRGIIAAVKTENGLRSVPMLPIVKTALHAARADQWNPHPDALVWETMNGTPWNRSTFAANVWSAWRAEAGVQIKWRHLRHYFVSQCAAAKIPMLTTSRWIGHSKFSFTMDRYGFLFDEDEAPALERLHARVTRTSQQ